MHSVLLRTLSSEGELIMVNKNKAVTNEEVEEKKRELKEPMYLLRC